jgi:hypothetical protein
MEEFLYKKYQNLGTFFTGSRKRQYFYFIVLLGLVGVITLEFYLGFKVESETMFWFFSSIVQSLMTLIGFMGVAVIFKYQSIAIIEERTLRKMNDITSVLSRIGGRLNSTSDEELLMIINYKTQNKIIDVELKRTKEDLESRIWLKQFLGDYMLKISIYAFSVVLLSLFFLSISKFVTNPFFAVSILYICFFLVADILRLVIKGIASTISSN